MLACVCPVSKHSVTVSYLVSAQVEQFPNCFSRGSFKNALYLPLSTNELPISSRFLVVQPLITPLAVFVDLPRAG
jgi:hypothetical protein